MVANCSSKLKRCMCNEFKDLKGILPIARGSWTKVLMGLENPVKDPRRQVQE